MSTPPRAPAAWTRWKPLDSGPHLASGVLAEILDGGQAFRWWPHGHGAWVGQWADNIAEVRISASNTLEWRCPSGNAERVRDTLPHYLGLDAAHAAAVDALPWRSDAHLHRAMHAFPGLRLLRQPFGETLLAFLCSATKQIVQIKQMVALLATRLGRPATCHSPSDIPLVGTQRECHLVSDMLPGGIGWRLPTWAELADVSEAELRACLLGFRARYIRETATFIASRPGWLEGTEALPYAQAKARLCELPGVGEKVADCVLLFGGGRDEAFPVDVWILKAMARRYGLDGWSPAQVAHFGRVHFGAHAGLAQQYLFAFERASGRGGGKNEPSRSGPSR